MISTPTHGSVFYIQARDVSRTFTDPTTSTITTDDDLFRSNGQYATVYQESGSSSYQLTFSVSDVSDATPFRLSTQTHPLSGQQDDLFSIDDGLTLNTDRYDRSAIAYFDVNPIGGGWYPPGCRITSTSGSVPFLRCILNQQTEFSICFGNSDPNDPARNGLVVYLSYNPVRQGDQCRSITANVVWQ